MTKKTEQIVGSQSLPENEYSGDAVFNSEPSQMEYNPVDQASEIGLTSPSQISEPLEVDIKELALDVQILKKRFEVFIENYAYKADISERFDKIEALLKRHFGDY